MKERKEKGCRNTKDKQYVKKAVSLDFSVSRKDERQNSNGNTKQHRRKKATEENKDRKKAAYNIEKEKKGSSQNYTRTLKRRMNNRIGR